MTDTIGSLGYWIRRRRKALDLTQHDLARRIGCAVSTIRKWEADARRPGRDTVERLADTFGLAPPEREAFLRVARNEAWAGDLTVSDQSAEAGWVTPLLDTASSRLPIPTTPLIGRAREVATIYQLLDSTSARVVILIGPGGVGKTRLALQVAADLQSAFADGIAFVDLAPVHDPTLVPTVIAQALGLTDAGEEPILRRLHTILHARHFLLVLDNFEHLLAAAPVVADLLAVAPRLKVLITSRVVVGIYGESTFLVPSLSLPDQIDHSDLDRLMDVESVRLFVERARAAHSDFSLSEAHASAISAICHVLDGLPLAIELAAARVRLFSPQALLRRLSGERMASGSGRLDVLTGGARTLPARQQTLRATIAWSYDLLDTDAQRLFRRLAVFVGGYTLAAAEDVCEHEDDRKQTARELQTLLDNSLIQQRAGVDGEIGFNMLETIREFALEQLVASGEIEGLQQRHANYFLAIAEIAEPETSEAQGQWWDRLEEDIANLRAALTWSSAQPGGDIGLRLALALVGFWRGRGYLSEGRGWLARLARHRQVNDNQESPAVAHMVLRANALCWLGTLGVFQGDYSGEEAFEESLALFRTLDDRAGMADVLGDLGMMLLMKGDDERAQSNLEESLMLAREIGNEDLIGTRLFFLGTLVYAQGNTQQAGTFWEESIPHFGAVGTQWMQECVRMHLAMIAVERDQNELAEAQAAESLDFFRNLGDHSQIVYALEVMGCVAAAQGRRSEESTPSLCRAGRLFGAAEVLRQVEGITRLRYFLPFYERGLSALHAHLDPALLVLAWNEGRAMTLEQAITHALEKR